MDHCLSLSLVPLYLLPSQMCSKYCSVSHIYYIYQWFLAFFLHVLCVSCTSVSIQDLSLAPFLNFFLYPSVRKECSSYWMIDSGLSFLTLNIESSYPDSLYLFNHLKNILREIEYSSQICPRDLSLLRYSLTTLSLNSGSYTFLLYILLTLIR